VMPVMNRVILIHWNAGEAAECAERLRRAGYDVSHFGADRGAAGYRALRDDPPDAFVIDLSRMPSHGRAVGVFLRQQKGTRHVPIVFAGGSRARAVAGRRVH
jgi:DNA-binding response OmpR family regulator